MGPGRLESLTRGRKLAEPRRWRNECVDGSDGYYACHARDSVLILVLRLMASLTPSLISGPRSWMPASGDQLLARTILPVGLGAPPLGSMLTAKRSTVFAFAEPNEKRTEPDASGMNTPALIGVGDAGSISHS